MITEIKIKETIKKLEEEYIGAIYCGKGCFIAYDYNEYDLFAEGNYISSFKDFNSINNYIKELKL